MSAPAPAGRLSAVLRPAQVREAAAALVPRLPELAPCLPGWLPPADGPQRHGTPVEPALAAALAVHADAWARVDVDVLDGAAVLRGRWSLGAVGASALVLGAGRDGDPSVEVSILPPGLVASDVQARLPADPSPGVPSPGRPAPAPAGEVAAADVLALTMLDGPGARALLADVAGREGDAAADLLGRCAGARRRVDVQVRAAATLWCGTWLAAPGWLRLDPGASPGLLRAVPVGRRDVGTTVVRLLAGAAVVTRRPVTAREPEVLR